MLSLEPTVERRAKTLRVQALTLARGERGEGRGRLGRPAEGKATCTGMRGPVGPLQAGPQTVGKRLGRT